MRSLSQALQDHELIVLRVIGEWWEVDLTGQDKRGCIDQLSQVLPNLDIPQELIYLPPDEAAAVRALVQAGGRMPVATFRRQYGDVRDLGPAALEREEPWFDPQSSAEDLWYRGFIYRGFDQTDDGMVEYFFLPDEFLFQFDPPPAKEEKGKKKKKKADPDPPEQNADPDPPKPKAENKPTKPKPKPKSPSTAKKGKAKTVKPPPIPTQHVEELEYAPIDDDYIEEIDEDAVPDEEAHVPGQSAAPDLPDEEWADLSKPIPENRFGRSSRSMEENERGQAQARVARNSPAPSAPPQPSSPVDAQPPRTFAMPAEIEIEPPLALRHETLCVDDFTTIMTLSQAGKLKDGSVDDLLPYLLNQSQQWIKFLIYLGLSMETLKKINDRYRPTKATVGWLQQPRETQMRMLAEAWVTAEWNELRHVPTLRCEGSGWENDPILARNALLDGITLSDEWVTFDSLLQRIKKENSDFQRPNGNYDTWYIRDVVTGQYLSGYDSWEDVEGRLLRFLIERPLQWLGMSEVSDDRFRLTTRAVAWLQEDGLPEREKQEPIEIRNDGVLHVPFVADRYKRFQVSRFARMLPATDDSFFTYRITPSSLERARQDGIDLGRVRKFLGSIQSGQMPAGLSRALERWSQNGPEGFVEAVVILRVKDQSILTKLRQHPKTRPLLSESLGSHAAIVMADQWDELCSLAATLGLLLEPPS